MRRSLVAPAPVKRVEVPVVSSGAQTGGKRGALKNSPFPLERGGAPTDYPRAKEVTECK